MLGRVVLVRIACVPLIMFGVMTILFFGARVIPGDPARLMAGPEASFEDVERLRQELGLDRPLMFQYVRFLSELARGDLGRSLRTYRPVSEEIIHRVWPSFVLALSALGIGLFVGIPSGVVAAVKQGRWIDTLTIGLTVVGVSTPVFVIGLVLMWLFSSRLGLLPSTGYGSPRHLILPAVTLGVYTCAGIARMTRSSMLEVLRQDYVRTARAKGLLERSVVLRHALRNAAIPILTLGGIEFAGLLGGAVITETVFAWPGLGSLVVGAVKFRDYPLLQGGVAVLAVAIVLVNLCIEVAYGLVDPRVSVR